MKELPRTNSRFAAERVQLLNLNCINPDASPNCPTRTAVKLTDPALSPKKKYSAVTIIATTLPMSNPVHAAQ
jgi:hypothetical protein